MDSYEWNKVFGALLGTVLLVLAINIGVDMVMKPHHDGHAKTQFPDVAGGDDHGGDGEKPAAEDNTPPDWGTVLAAADLTAGEKVHKKCVQCHTFDKGGKNGIGPNLWNIVNAPHGGVEGFSYSAAIKGKPGPWTYDELYAFLKKPNAYAPGTKMAFAGLPKREDRINLIAWLRTRADTPADIPEPKPAAPAAPAEGAPAEGAPAEGAPAAPGATPADAAPAGGAPAAPAPPEGTPATPSAQPAAAPEGAAATPATPDAAASGAPGPALHTPAAPIPGAAAPQPETPKPATP